MNYTCIFFEGNIGAGKTFFASKMAEYLNCRFIPERFNNNIFLEKFYSSPKEFALQVELSFLLDRYELLQVQKPNELTIADFSFLKSLIFAGINLTKEEFDLFQNLYTVLKKEVIQPEIIIYLHREKAGLKKNILQRGRIYELQIPDTYLLKIDKAYHHYYLQSPTVPVLYFDLSTLNIEDNMFFIKKIARALNQNWAPGVHYMNGV